MKLPEFEYASPATPQEVVRLLASRPGETKIIAGGQSLLPTMAFRLAQPALLVDIRKVQGLDRIEVDASGVTLGARTRWRQILDDQRLQQAHPLLAEAISHVAHYQVRNRGTVGGSLAHADPASEMPCIAVTCEAVLRVLGAAGERQIRAVDFLRGPLTTALAEDEMILSVHLPAWPAARRWSFLEFSRRPGDFALAAVALYYDVDGNGLASNAHIGVAGACHYAKRLSQAEAALNGQRVTPELARHAGALAAAEADPTGDFHASAAYRKALAGTLLERALLSAAKAA